MSVDVVVIGAGGFGRETLDVIEAYNVEVCRQEHRDAAIRILGVADDFPSESNLKRLKEREYKYLGTTEDVIAALEPRRFVLAVGDPLVKHPIDQKFLNAGWKALTVVHPGATVGTRCELGEGNIICSGAQISTNTRFGRHVHVNPNATIGHDTVLEDYVSVNPGAVISGEVVVRRDSLVGAASVILQGIEIGRSCVVGASACVVKDLDPKLTVVGIPARPLSDKQSKVAVPSWQYEEDD